MLCPECGKDEKRISQHRLHKKHGGILCPRNKKRECYPCQRFFDEAVLGAVRKMRDKNQVVSNEELKRGNKSYYLENSSLVVPAGGSVIISTGSQVQAGTACMVDVPYTGKKGYPATLDWADGAIEGQDKV